MKANQMSIGKALKMVASLRHKGADFATLLVLVIADYSMVVWDSAFVSVNILLYVFRPKRS